MNISLLYFINNFCFQKEKRNTRHFGMGSTYYTCYGRKKIFTQRYADVTKPRKVDRMAFTAQNGRSVVIWSYHRSSGISFKLPKFLFKKYVIIWSEFWWNKIYRNLLFLNLSWRIFFNDFLFHLPRVAIVVCDVQ